MRMGKSMSCICSIRVIGSQEALAVFLMKSLRARRV